MVKINEAGGSVWLDVYRFPRDLWLKDLETKQVTVIIDLRKNISGRKHILYYMNLIINTEHGHLLMFISNASFLEAHLQFTCCYVCWHCFLSCFNEMIMFCCLFCRPHKPQAPPSPNYLQQSYS